MNLESQSNELQKTQSEVKRLVRNWRALLDIMPEMVFLVREDYVVEYMNASAVNFFGDLREQLCYTGLHKSNRPCIGACPVKSMMKEEGFLESIEMQIGDSIVEYNFVPFQGYKGDRLVMINMRDITQRKRHEEEIAAFNTNIETILRRKIDELHESEKIRENLLKKVDVLKSQLNVLHKTDEMVGSSKVLRQLRDLIYQVANSDATILISGESGTGKELAANLIRNCSNRADKPFLKVNCNTINDNLLESDLFGYEKGAFTGAATRKKGKFEIVSGGTIFLDEIGEISPRMQASLLRILQNGEIIRVGGNETIKVDVRILAATNADLAKAVQDGTFRLDLYYRLNIINIFIPPLRQRKEDIIELASYFVKRYRKAFNKDIDFLPNDIIELLIQHSWPGNIRELENVIQRAVLMAKNNVITEKEIVFDKSPLSAASGGAIDGLLTKIDEQLARDVPLKKILGDIENTIILASLDRNDWNAQNTAKALGVGKTAFYDKLKRYEISAKNLKN